MAIIYTKKGVEILVDDEDHEWLSRFTWCVVDYIGYATTSLGRIGGKVRTISMHTMLVIAPPGYVVDHVNRNKRDNRKSNLRPATKSENAYNVYPQGTIKQDRATRKWWFVRNNELIGIYDNLSLAKAAKREARGGKMPKVTNTTIPID